MSGETVLRDRNILGEIGWIERVVYFNDPCVCVCSRMRVRSYVGMRACVMCFAIYDNKI